MVVVDMSVFLFLSVFLTHFLDIHGKKSTKKALETVLTAEETNLDVFCRNRDSLIKVKGNAEFCAVDTYVNNSLCLQCKFCEEQDDGFPKLWYRQKRIFIGNVTEVELSMSSDIASVKMFVTRSHSLVIRNVGEDDVGLYFCKAPYVDNLGMSFNYMLDVMNRAAEDVNGSLKGWKNYSQYYLEPLNRVFASKSLSFFNYMRTNVVIFTEWMEWSECDACSSTPVRRRIGRCRVKPLCKYPRRHQDQDFPDNCTFFDDKHNTEPLGEEQSCSAVSNIFIIRQHFFQYAMSLSCRSLLLKELLPRVYEYTFDVPDYVLHSNCTGVCKGRLTSNGPRYKRSIILTQGAHLTLVCPDSTTVSDVVWEHNKRRLYPNEGFDYVEGSAEPRIYIDSFSTLYLFEVTERESGNYTCFVDGVSMQEVRIVVLKRSVFFVKEFRKHLKYLTIVFLLCFVAYLCGITLICLRKRQEERRTGLLWRSDESERLLFDKTDSA